MQPIEIRASLLMKGKTLKQFAEMIGTSRQTIHGVVSGRTKKKKYRAAIASFLGKDIFEIWPDEQLSLIDPAVRALIETLTAEQVEEIRKVAPAAGALIEIAIDKKNSSAPANWGNPVENGDVGRSSDPSRG